MNNIFKKLIFIFLIFFSSYSYVYAQEQKIKIGLLVPLSGDNQDLGELIIKASRMALKDIGENKIEIFPKDTGSNPTQTLKSAYEFKEMGINIVIGPVFYKSLTYLDEIKDITFLSLTNKTILVIKIPLKQGLSPNQIQKVLQYYHTLD